MGRPSQAEIQALRERLAEPLEAAYVLGQQAHADFDIPRALHAAALVERLWRRAKRQRAADIEARLREAIPRLAAEDMYFVIACTDAANDKARECFLRTFTPTVCRVFHLRGLTPHDSLTQAQAVLTEHLYPSPGHRTGLASYAGESSLSTYLSMLAHRHADKERFHRPSHGGRPEHPGAGDGDDEAPEDDPKGAAHAPESLADIHDILPRFTAALAAAGLTDAQVIALHHAIVHGQAQVDIARLLRRTPGPVSRLLARATQALSEALIRSLSRKDRDAIGAALHGDDRRAHALIHAAFLAYLQAEFQRRSSADPEPPGGMSTTG